MGCFVGCLALLFPRIALVAVFLMSNYLGRAYETVLWPVLGFFFMPLTTLAYAWAVNTNGTVTGVYLVVVVVAVLMDLGTTGKGASEGRKRWD
ncbi:MAG TPA: hypothetical protein VEK15_23780 [Vicinamibacteria bacterium]|nr:hypothetical protein [Vicinamibacteria bacterium]